MCNDCTLLKKPILLLLKVENCVNILFITNTNTETENQYLEWHKDKDEKLFETTRKFCTCTDGFILYVSIENLEGGFLEISSDMKGNF